MSNRIIVAAAIATILATVLVLIDFIFNRWNYLKKLVYWIRKRVRGLKIDQTPVVLRIPPPPPISSIPTSPPGTVAGETPDGVAKHLVKYIMSGTRQQLMAYETTRQGFPGTRFLVERVVPNQDPRSYLTPDRDKANAQWREWYDEWRKQPGGFGGSFGTGLDGQLPW